MHFYEDEMPVLTECEHKEDGSQMSIARRGSDLRVSPAKSRIIDEIIVCIKDAYESIGTVKAACKLLHVIIHLMLCLPAHMT